MMALGIGYRLMPIVLAAAMPLGRSLYMSAALLEVGAVGLFVALILRSAWSAAFAACAAAAFAAFAVHVRRMRRRTPAAGLPKPDVGVWHALQALAEAFEGCRRLGQPVDLAAQALDLGILLIDADGDLDAVVGTTAWASGQAIDVVEQMGREHDADAVLFPEALD